ncbi:MAG: lipid-A-disaccharide synthase [Parachlamydiales bacterium]
MGEERDCPHSEGAALKTHSWGKTLFILAGEASGDLQAAELAKRLAPHYHLIGVAGPRMRAAGVEAYLPMEEFQLMGFTDVLKTLPKLILQFRTLRDRLLARHPDAVILVDYGGFNIRLATSLRKHGYRGKIFYYIGPKVWAWGKGRIPKLAKSVDLMMAIMPFEPEVYAGSGLRCEYVGNPLTQLVEGYASGDEFLLGLFPGSRRSEIKLNLPHMLEAAAFLKRQHPDLKIEISVANEGVRPLIEKLTKGQIPLTPDSYPLMLRCRAALATSGTVTLELGLRKVPTVVVYRVSLLNAFLARCLFRINLPYYGLVNIIANENLFQERIHTRLSPEKTAAYVDELLRETPQRAKVIAGCERVIELLKSDDPAMRCAKLIRELLPPIATYRAEGAAGVL